MGGAALRAAMTAVERACLPEQKRHAGSKAVVAGWKPAPRGLLQHGAPVGFERLPRQRLASFRGNHAPVAVRLDRKRPLPGKIRDDELPDILRRPPHNFPLL